MRPTHGLQLEPHGGGGSRTPIPPTHQYFPGANEQPWFYPPALPTPGRWVWIPDQPRFGCAACANGGVCACVRPEREIMCGTIGSVERFDTMTVTVTANYESSSVAHVGQH